MELKFQKPRNVSFLTTKSSRTKSCKKNEFLGVRQRPSGRWVAEIKNSRQKIRMWLGTFDTAEEAAQTYDEAAFLLRGSDARKNFVDHCPPVSHIAMKIKSLLNQKKASKHNVTFTPTTSCTKTTKKFSSQNTSHVLPICYNEDFNTIQEELLNNFSFLPPYPVIETSTEKSSQTDSAQSYSGNTSPMASWCLDQDFRISDYDVYKPDLSQFLDGGENGIGSFQFGRTLGDEFYQLLSLKEEFTPSKCDVLVSGTSANHFPEFEHMKVERQNSMPIHPAGYIEFSYSETPLELNRLGAESLLDVDNVY